MTDRRRVDGLVLAPGAGAGREQPGLVAIEAALVPVGVACERIDFPYRLAGRPFPDPPERCIASFEQGLEAIAARLEVARGRLGVGGRSFGGRIASMTAATSPDLGALICVSYPLHHPQQLERWRSAHFPAITVPALFISGSRDAYGSPRELERALNDIAGPVELVVLDGAEHGLRAREEEIGEAILEWLGRI